MPCRYRAQQTQRWFPAMQLLAVSGHGCPYVMLLKGRRLQPTGRQVMECWRYQAAHLGLTDCICAQNNPIQGGTIDRQGAYTTSASGRCLSISESAPSLLSVTMKVWPFSSSQLRSPSSFSTHPAAQQSVMGDPKMPLLIPLIADEVGEMAES